jgi:hypothetical protein
MKTLRVIKVSAILLCACLTFRDTNEAETLVDSVTVDGTSTLTVAPPGAHKDRTLHVHTLYLTGGKIVTNGNTLHIIADQIISKNGSIVAFDKNQTPPDAPDGQSGVDGLDGGTLEINATSVVGTLKIVLKGQNGGRGGRGQPGNNGAPGRRGDDAADHLFDCGRAGGDGAPGGDGTAGGPGSPGGVAGKSGTVILKGNLKGDDPTLDIDVSESTPGSGGPGGKGGAGGPGGDGGSGSVHCGGGAHGPNGHPAPDGPDGAQGAKGAPGRVT